MTGIQPMYVGHAITPSNTDLDALFQIAQNAGANAVNAQAGVVTNAGAIAGINARVPAPTFDRVVATQQAWMNHVPTLHAADYAPDGYTWGVTAATDTTYAQAALTAGATYQKVVNFGSLVVKLNAGLTSAGGPGIIFDKCTYGVAGDAGFLCTGSGYTAVTITSAGGVGGIAGSQYRFTVYGTANAVNGIFFDNPLLMQVQKIRAYNLAGFGIKIDKCYDCTYLDMSVELCNPPAGVVYSFSVNPAGDTANMSHFGRIQVERCGLTNGRVMYVDGSTLSCVFDNIHSEQATAIAGVDTWYLGGSRSTYNTARLQSVSGANATLKIGAGNTTYTDFLVEGATDVSVDAGSTTSTVTFVSPEIQGTFHPTSGQAGTINIIGGSIVSASDPVSGTGMILSGGLRAFGTRFTTLSIGFVAGPDPEIGKFFGCKIDTLASTSNNASATFTACEILEAGNLLGGINVFNESKVTSAGAMALTTSRLIARGSTLVATGLTYANNRPIRGFGSAFPVMSCTDAGAADILFDTGMTIAAGSTGIGVPTGGAHAIGDWHRNLVPVVGQPTGWVCTVAGTPGTFVALANL